MFIVTLLIVLPTSSPASSQLLYTIIFLLELLLKRYDSDNNMPSIVERDCPCAKHISVYLLHRSHTKTFTRLCTEFSRHCGNKLINRPPLLGCVGAPSSSKYGYGKYTLVYFPYPPITHFMMLNVTLIGGCRCQLLEDSHKVTFQATKYPITA